MGRRRHFAEREHPIVPIKTAQKSANPQTQFQPSPMAWNNSHSVLHLQRMIGNVAVQRILAGGLQRQPDDAATVEAPEQVKLLNSAQVAKAISYYHIRKKQYTPEIITQIQVQVGVEPTGIVDETMVQAVARFQSTITSLKVDGMAGPRTLPAAFPAGLEAEERVDKFVEQSREVQDQWADLDDAQARADALMEAVNEQLTDSEVPQCEYVLEELDSGTVAQFDFATWTIELGQEAFEQDVLSNEETADAANTVYHEARHAEQWYRMAQMLAGQGKTADEIVDDMGIPAEVAAEAVGDPLDPESMEALIADGWYESVYGSSAKQRNRIFKELEAADKELEKAHEAFNDNPSQANERRLQRARERRQKAFDAYHDLPEENDAHRVGDTISARLLLKDD
jgi:hypothetical protein